MYNAFRLPLATPSATPRRCGLSCSRWKLKQRLQIRLRCLPLLSLRPWECWCVGEGLPARTLHRWNKSSAKRLLSQGKRLHCHRKQGSPMTHMRPQEIRGSVLQLARPLRGRGRGAGGKGQWLSLLPSQEDWRAPPMGPTEPQEEVGCSPKPQGRLRPAPRPAGVKVLLFAQAPAGYESDLLHR